MVGGEDGRGPGSGLPSRIRHDEQVRYGAIQKAANERLWNRETEETVRILKREALELAL